MQSLISWIDYDAHDNYDNADYDDTDNEDLHITFYVINRINVAFVMISLYKAYLAIFQFVAKFFSINQVFRINSRIFNKDYSITDWNKHGK